MRGWERAQSRPRVVVAGLGDTGVLTAVRLAKRYDVVGISAKPALVSGQELGLRLTRPEWWAPGLPPPLRAAPGARPGAARARRAHRAGPGRPAGRGHRRRRGERPRSRTTSLVIATGVSNGFWRRPDVESAGQVAAGIEDAHRRLADARLDRGDRRGSGGREHGLERGPGVAGQARRPLLPGREGACPSTTAGSGPGSRASSPGRRGPPPRSPRRRTARLRLRPDHRPSPSSGAPGQEAIQADAVVWAIGRTAPQHRLAAGGAPRRGRLRAGRPRPQGPRAPTACSRSVTSPRPTRCARPPGTSRSSCWPATSAPTSSGTAARDVRAAEAPVGLGDRLPGRRAGRLHAPRARASGSRGCRRTGWSGHSSSTGAITAESGAERAPIF